MFTVKFIKNEEGVGSVIDSISCPHYGVFERDSGGYTITTYLSHIKTGGAERHISKRPIDYDACFVENISGKTIAKFSS